MKELLLSLIVFFIGVIVVAKIINYYTDKKLKSLEKSDEDLKQLNFANKSTTNYVSKTNITKQTRHYNIKNEYQPAYVPEPVELIDPIDIVPVVYDNSPCECENLYPEYQIPDDENIRNHSHVTEPIYESFPTEDCNDFHSHVSEPVYENPSTEDYNDFHSHVSEPVYESPSYDSSSYDSSSYDSSSYDSSSSYSSSSDY